MPTVALAHCEEVVVWGPSPPPHDVVLTLQVGGSSGAGHVTVDGAPGQLPAPFSVPTGSSGTYPIPGVSEIRLHYFRAPGGPPTVPVTFDVT